MQDKFQKTVEEFRVYSERANVLFRETAQCLEEMENQAKLSKDAITDMFSTISMDEIQRTLNKTPAVVFIGNRNCGKSAILNELLGGTILPVHETPCTSRIVKIGYTPNENTVRVVDKMGTVIKPLIKFTKRVPEDYVVASHENRDQSQHLRWTVEISLNHPFLKSGIELFDSPGRNENDALDDVVDSFFEKETTPLVVYIIDGNEQLRSSVSNLPTNKFILNFLKRVGDESEIMYLLTEWEGRTGKYLARGHGGRTERSEVRAP